nr:hypothetical protein 5 [bacterium]
MAVIIQNMTEKRGGVYGKGKQSYDLRINYNKLCEVEHNFEDGLATLLRLAADKLDYVEDK